MTLLVRKLLRDLWHVRWRAIAVIVAVASGVGIFGGASMAINTGFHTRDVLLERMHFADLEVLFLPEDAANLPDLTSVPGVRTVERRLVLPGTVSGKNGTRLGGVMVFLETVSPRLNMLEVTEGRALQPGDFESAVVERSLAAYHDVEVGDRIAVQVGRKTYDSRVDGIVTSPEYLVTTANPEYLLPERGSFGVVFGGLDRVSDALGFTMINDLLFEYEPGHDPATVRAAVLGRLARLNLERVIPRDEHFMYRFVQVQMEAFQVYAPCMMVVIGVLAFVLTLITMVRLVLDQRREIGALLALGYSPRQVTASFALAGLLLGSLGALLGVGLALVFRNLFAIPYAMALGMPDVVLAFDPWRLVTGFVLGVVETVAATMWPVWRLLRLPPQAVIREPMAEGVEFGRWVPASAAVLSLPLPVQYGLRNVLRRPGRTASTIVAIGCSLGVPVAFIVSLTSALETPAIVFERDGWHYAVDFLYPMPDDEVASLATLPGVSRMEPYFRRFAELGRGGRYESATILGLQPDSRMKSTLLSAGRMLVAGDDDEVVVSHDLARRLKLSVGDTVSLRLRSQVEVSRHVVGISGEMVPGQVLMPFTAAQKVLDAEGEVTGVYLATSGDTSALASTLGGFEFVAKVTTKAGVTEGFRKLVAGMMQMMYVNIVVSISVALLFIVMSVNLVISERQAEYATFKCLGYGRRRLGTMVLGQAFGEGIAAALLAVVIAAGLALYLNIRVSQAWHQIINIFRPIDFLVVLLPALALIPLAAYPGLRQLDRLDIVQALAARRIE